MLYYVGLNNVPIIGMTKELKNDFRDDEINEWLSRHDIDKFVIIDDATDFHENQDEFIVRTEFEVGLTLSHTELRL